MASASGEVVLTPEGYHAFVPEVVPPEIDWAALAMPMSAADARLSELSGLGSFVPNPHLLIAPYVNREAVASSRIEGTQADLADLFIEGLAPDAEPDVSDVREVGNYVRALNHGLSRLDRLPLAGRLIREMHEELLSGVRGDRLLPGEFRRSQNWIRGSGPGDALYVPPPAVPPSWEPMSGCFAGWERFVNARGILPELVQCGVMHERFEAIHPFLDGNGRIGRLLITLFLIQRGRLSKPLLYLSSYIERNKVEYYDLLQRVRTHGDWTSWLTYFLHAVEVTAGQAVAHAGRIVRLHEDLRAQVPASKHRAKNLVSVLFANPFVDAKRAVAALGVADDTARRSIAVLEELGLLRERTGQRWGKVWVSDVILDAFADPPEVAT